MKHNNLLSYGVDNSAILFLALLRKTHSNIYRFSVTLTENVDPMVLQKAVDRTYKRFPTIFASVKPGFTQYRVQPLTAAPAVKQDPGCLITMSADEIESCAIRVIYQNNVIAIETYHVLTDGCGAIATINTLTAEYLRLYYGVKIPVSHTLYDVDEKPKDEETEDAYLIHQAGKPMRLPSRYAYQLPGKANDEWRVFNTRIQYSTHSLLNAAHRYGVSLNSFLVTVMADSVMDIQCRHNAGKKLRPVRIMAPVDLRRLFPSKTLRNFALYTLPTLELEQRFLPFAERVALFHQQQKSGIDKEKFASIMAYNVRVQKSWYFRWLPARLKFAFIRFGYRFFGESNSSVTFTNLGNVKMPAEMEKYVLGMDLVMTPRRGSPYGCTLISYQDRFVINISRFCHETELIDVFTQKLDEILAEE